MLVLKIILSVLVGLAGVAKLVGAKPMAEQFEEFGLPRVVMYVVGVLEVTAAIAIQLGPTCSAIASGGLIAMPLS
ncbi:MAG TPA: DoxX family protein [Phycisphaerae bacterium]|nr:DoxX family protein [Phycisphaerae bacterium]